MATNDFPHVINGVEEKDTTVAIFASMAHFDTETLLRCRAVSKGWRDGIDAYTTLWSRMSMMRAVQENRLDICELIVEHAEDKNPPSKKDVFRPGRYIHAGWTPLHEAARQGLSDICRLIIEAVDDKNPADQKGNTPLHEAAKKVSLMSAD